MGSHDPATANNQSVANLITSFDQFEQLLSSLTPEQWSVQSLCPDWDVKGVVLHVVGIEHVLTDWKPGSAEDAPPFEQLGPFIDEHTDSGPDQLTAVTADVFARRRANLGQYGSEVFDQPCMTPVGPGTYGSFLDVRTFDIWVHHRDISTPVGLDSDDGGPAAEAALDQIHRSLGYIVGKKIALPDGMSIVFNVHGPIERSMAVVVDGRAKVVDSVERPTVEVTCDALTFIQLACGRIDPEEQIEAGRIGWSGDETWGRKSASSLAFTM